MTRPTLAFVMATLLTLVTPASSGDAERKELRAGFPMSSFTSSSSSDARIATTVFLKHVFADAQIPYTGQAFETGEEFLTAVKHRSIDFFVVNSDFYLEHEEELDARPILVSQRAKEPVETFVLIAKAGIQLSSLKDSTLVIDSSARGKMPYRWISDYLIQSGSGEVADEYFIDIDEVSSASRAVLPVYFGKHDAAIVSAASFDKMSDHNPNIAKRLHIVCRSKLLVSALVCVREDYVGQHQREVIAVAKSLPESTDGRHFLDRIGAKKLVAYKPEYLHHNREIYHRTEAAKKGARK